MIEPIARLQAVAGPFALLPQLRLIRPPDPAIRGATLRIAPYTSAVAARRYIDLAFRDAHTAIDLTLSRGGFWKGAPPPGLAVTTSDIDPASAADLHLDFTATGMPDGAFDLAVLDPPHLADLGVDSIMGRRFGTTRGSTGLEALVVDGVREAWRIARIGILVKLADTSHGGEFLTLTRWAYDALGVDLYFSAQTYRAPLEDGKWQVQRVVRNNGADWLVFRKDGGQHKDFARLYERQEARKAKRSKPETGLPERPDRCSECFALLDQTSRKYRRTCSRACRLQAYRARAKGAPLRAYRRRGD